MRNRVATFTTALLLLVAAVLLTPRAAAWGQSESGGVLDFLNSLLRGGQTLRGNVVLAEDTRLVVRGDDGRTYVVDTPSAEAAATPRLQPGQAVNVTARGDGGTLAASRVEPGEGGAKTFYTVRGAVESVTGSQVTFKTVEGMRVPLDLSRVVGRKPDLAPNQPATLVYEQRPAAAVAAVWIEPDRVQPSAAVNPSAPGAAGAFERVHGYVESVDLGTLSLKADDGRTLLVDTTQVSAGARDAIRPGDLVTVVGKPTGGANEFRAELIQREGARP